MRWLLLDAGNTALKWALSGTDEPRALARGVVELGAPPALAAAVRQSLRETGPEASLPPAFGCSVASETLTQAIAAEVAPVTAAGVRWVHSQARFELNGVALLNGYRDPAQLGADRWHAMVAARMSFPDRPLVVVCAGTATTVDSIDAAGRFLAGTIAPGSALMTDSLARGTARLPRSTGQAVELPDNTDDAIATGVADAQAGLVERRVRALARAIGPPQLVIAGGRGSELAARLCLAGEVSGVTIEEHLILNGLWFRASADAAAGRTDPR